MLARGVDNSLLRFGLGKACLDEGEAEQAMQHLQKCLSFDPAYSAAWKLLGQACLKQGLDAEACLAWENGLEIALPPGTTIGAVIRDEEVLIAHDDTVIESGDHVILFLVDKKYIRDVERLFQVGLTFF